MTFAATGSSLILGKVNKAGGPTTLTNNGNGPALVLGSKSGYPSLKVSSTEKVAKLNADRVDGLDSNALEPRLARVSLGDAGSALPSDGKFLLVDVPGGWYEFSIAGLLNSETATDMWVCMVGDLDKLSGVEPDYATGYYTYDQGTFDSGDLGVVGHSQVVKVDAGSTTVIGCAGSGTGPVEMVKPVPVVFRGVETPLATPGTPYDPTPRLTPRLPVR